MHKIVSGWLYLVIVKLNVYTKVGNTRLELVKIYLKVYASVSLKYKY